MKMFPNTYKEKIDDRMMNVSGVEAHMNQRLTDSQTENEEKALNDVSNTASSLKKCKHLSIFLHDSSKVRFICGLPGCRAYSQENVLSSVDDNDVVSYQKIYLQYLGYDVSFINASYYSEDDSSNSSRSKI